MNAKPIDDVLNHWLSRQKDGQQPFRFHHTMDSTGLSVPAEYPDPTSKPVRTKGSKRRAACRKNSGDADDADGDDESDRKSTPAKTKRRTKHTSTSKSKRGSKRNVPKETDGSDGDDESDDISESVQAKPSKPVQGTLTQSDNLGGWDDVDDPLDMVVDPIHPILRLDDQWMAQDDDIQTFTRAASGSSTNSPLYPTAGPNDPVPQGYIATPIIPVDNTVQAAGRTRTQREPHCGLWMNLRQREKQPVTETAGTHQEGAGMRLLDIEVGSKKRKSARQQSTGAAKKPRVSTADKPQLTRKVKNAGVADVMSDPPVAKPRPKPRPLATGKNHAK
jgi:hypothetical protein